MKRLRSLASSVSREDVARAGGHVVSSLFFILIMLAVQRLLGLPNNWQLWAFAGAAVYVNHVASAVEEGVEQVTRSAKWWAR